MPATTAPIAHAFSASETSRLSRRLRPIYVAWVILAGLLSLIAMWRGIHQDFAYPHAWVAADCATMARTFATQGTIALRGVPVPNNAPLGISPPAYTHWPPLFPLLLGFWFELLGASETTTHLFMLVLWVMTVAMLVALARLCFSPCGVCMVATAWMCVPAVVRYAHTAIQIHLCILLMLAAMFCLLRSNAQDGWTGEGKAWAALGTLTTIGSVMASWEGLLLPLGCLAYAFVTRDRWIRRLSLIYVAAGVVTFGAILTWYVIVYPRALTDVLGVMLVRMRMTKSFAVDPLNDGGIPFALSAAQVIVGEVIRTWDMLGTLSLFALALLAAEFVRNRGRFENAGLGVVVAGFAGLCTIWYTVFAHHVANHEFQALIAAPLAAIGIARLIERGIGSTVPVRSGDGERVLAWAIIIPAVLIFPLAAAAWKVPSGTVEERDEVKFGRDLHALTPAGSVILTPEQNMVPVYYSERRIIRSVLTAARLEEVFAALPKAFSAETPVFFAMPSQRTSEANAHEYDGNRELMSSLPALSPDLQHGSTLLIPLGTAGHLTRASHTAHASSDDSAAIRAEQGR